MILGIGIGNTNIRCAIGTKGDYRQVFLSTEKIFRAEDFICFLEEHFQADIWRFLQGGIISTVVPSKLPIIKAAVNQKNKELPLQMIDISKCNIDFSGYKGNLGEDRAVCCEAAVAKYKPPVVMVDLGTATTINVINAERVFLGGAILTGVQTGLTALTRRTAQLPKVGEYQGAEVISDDTQKSLISGAVIGTAYALEGYINQIRAELESELTVVLTGGNAPIVMPYCSFGFAYEPALLIDGLFTLYHKHRTLMV